MVAMASVTQLAVLELKNTRGDTCQFTALLHPGRTRVEVPFMPQSKCKQASIVDTVLVPPSVADTLPCDPEACVNRRFSVRATPPKENARPIRLAKWFQASSAPLQIVPPMRTSGGGLGSEGSGCAYCDGKLQPGCMFPGKMR